MMKKMFLCLIIVIMILMSFSTIFAYSNKYFSMDIPSEYQKFERQKMWLFMATSSEDTKAVFVYIVPGKNLNKSLKNISQEDIDNIFEEASKEKDYEILSTNRYSKFGNEEAIQIDAKSSETYMNLYIIFGNEYAYVVMFIAESEEVLDGSDFVKMKESFKINASSSIPSSIFLIIAIVIVVFAVKKGSSKKQLDENTQIDDDIQP